MTDRGRLWAARLLVAAGVLSLGLAAAELFAREALPPAKPLVSGEEIVVGRPEGTAFRLYTLKGVDAPLSATDVLRVLNFGDSVTEADCPRTELLQRLLSGDGSGVEFGGRRWRAVDVVNAGRSGSTVATIRANMKAALEMVPAPQIVTVLSSWSDHWYRQQPCRRLGCNRRGEEVFSLIQRAENLRFCEACQRVLTKRAQALAREDKAQCNEKLAAMDPAELVRGVDHGDTSIYQTPLPEYRETLRSIVELARATGAQVWLVTPPHGLKAGELPGLTREDCIFLDAARFLEIHRLYTQAIRDVAAQTGAGLVDVEAVFEARPDVDSLFTNRAYDPIHPGERGGNLAAHVFHQALAGTVRAQGAATLARDEVLPEVLTPDAPGGQGAEPPAAGSGPR